MARRKIASGSVYQPEYRDKKTGKLKHSAIWWLKYYVPGKQKPVRESAETEDREEAVDTLRDRMAKAKKRARLTDHPERVTVGQLLDLVLDDYKEKKRHSTYDVKCKIESRLRPAFGKLKAAQFGTQQIKSYKARRLRGEGKDDPPAAPATVNRELAVVRRAFKLGAKHDPPLVERVPSFEMLPEDNARTGTIDFDTYRTIRDLLPPYARLALVIGYHIGARKGEILAIQTAWVDFKRKRIELPGRITKNKKARFIPIYGDMEAEIKMAIEDEDHDEKCLFLIQRDGLPVGDFEKAWKTACESANVDSALFHDLRRTAVTNMIDAGMSEREAMDISGHKTRSTFDRYHIVSAKRMNTNADKMEAHLGVLRTESEEERKKVQGKAN